MIEIIDAVMGTGKTTEIIKRVNDNPNEKFIILTPFNNEVARYRDGLDKSEGKGGKRQDVVALDQKEAKTKTQRFKDAVNAGQCIIATHELFARFSDSDFKAMGNIKEYNLIIDETILLVDRRTIKNVDIQAAYRLGLIGKIDHPNIEGLAFYYELPAGEEHVGQDGSLSKIVNAVNGKHVWAVENNNVVFVVPPDKLEVFKNITVLTYLFKGSETNGWLEIFKLPFDHKELTMNGTLTTHCGYYTGEDFKHLLTIYDGKLNDIGKKSPGSKGFPLGSSWFSKRKEKDKDIKKIRNNTRTFFRNMGGNREDMLWTCFEDQVDWIRHNEFHLKDENALPKTWLASNTRATNNYRDRHVLAFLINVNQFPEIQNFFKKRGVTFSNDNFALSRLLQWTWRSAIRDKEPINIYLPSKRMRSLLKEWLKSPLARALTK